LSGQRALRAFAFHWGAISRVAAGRPVVPLRRISPDVSAFALIPNSRGFGNSVECGAETSNRTFRDAR
jgi:hypothetical protein